MWRSFEVKDNLRRWERHARAARMYDGDDMENEMKPRAVWTGVVIAVVLLSGVVSSAQAPQAPPATRPATPPVKQSPDGTIKLLAIDAQVIGQRARIEKKGDNPHNIGYWTNVDDKAMWRAVVERAGKYTIDVEYSLDRRAEGARYVIEFDGKAVRVAPEVTGTWMDFRTVRVGEVDLAKGAVSVTVRGEKKPGQAVLDLRGITLKPAAE
jgi:hypothetical protein